MAETANIPCPRGHELMRTTLGQLRNGHQSDAYAPGFQCDRFVLAVLLLLFFLKENLKTKTNKQNNRCHVVFEGNEEVVAHCSSCEFDCCAGCSAGMAGLLECNTGHQLRAVHQQALAAESRDYAGGSYKCDQCEGSSGGYPVRHCSTCRYDLCPQCVQRRLGFPVTPVTPPGHPMHPVSTHLAGRVVPPRPTPFRHNMGKVAYRPPPTRPPRSIEGEVEEVSPDEDGGIVGSGEWRRVLRNAGVGDTDLGCDDSRRLVFETVRGLIPADRRPATLTTLPPLGTIPHSEDSITAALRSAWTRKYGAPSTPSQRPPAAR